MISLALLCLVAHALFVSVTHHHSPRQNLSAQVTESVTAADTGNSGAVPDSNSDAHCLSCRLQRNFTSNVHTASVLIHPLEEPISREALFLQPGSAGSSLLLRGRAPPLA